MSSRNRDGPGNTHIVSSEALTPPVLLLRLFPAFLVELGYSGQRLETAVVLNAPYAL